MNPYSQTMRSSESDTDSSSRPTNSSDLWMSRQLTADRNPPPLQQRAARQAPFLPSA